MDAVNSAEVPWNRTVSEEEAEFGDFPAKHSQLQKRVSLCLPVPLTRSGSAQSVADIEVGDATNPPTPMQRLHTTDTMSPARGLMFDLDWLEDYDECMASAVPLMLPLKDDKRTMANIHRFASSGLLCGNLDESQEEEDCSPHLAPMLCRTESYRVPGSTGTLTNRRRSVSAPATTRAPGYRIAFLVNGSRGDVQPFLAVARLLIRKGNRVRIFANVDLCKIAEEFGVDSTPVFADMRWVITEVGGLSGTFNDAIAKGRKASQKYLRENKGMCVNADDALVDFRPQLLVANPGACGAAMRYEAKFKAPTCLAVCGREMLETMGDLLLLQPNRPHFFHVCAAFDNDPLPDLVTRTSEWYLETHPEPGELEEGGRFAELRNFLANGPPPVVISWGSMIAEGLPIADMLRLALRAARAVEKRAIIIGGWAGLEELGNRLIKEGRLEKDGLGEDEELILFTRESVCFVPYAPHTWLLPQCSCFVNHGGLGTTYAAMRAGLPVVITPIVGDQFHNAERVHQLGAGFGFEKPLDKVIVDELVMALHYALEDDCVAAARRVGFNLRGQRGEVQAVKVIESFYHKEVGNGAWAAKFDTHRKVVKCAASPRKASIENVTGKRTNS